MLPAPTACDNALGICVDDTDWPTLDQHQYHADLQVEVSSQQPGGGGPQAESELRGTFGRGVDNTKGPVA